MADERRRRLERDAAQGDLEAGAALLQERVREGDIDSERLRLAAHLGHGPAERAAPEAACPCLAWEPWHLGLWRWGREAPLRAALAVARAHDSEIDRAPGAPGEVYRACQAWLDDPGERTFRPVRAAMHGDALQEFESDAHQAVFEAYQAVRASLPAATLRRPRPLSRDAKALVREALLEWALAPGALREVPDPPEDVPPRVPRLALLYMDMANASLAQDSDRVVGFLGSRQGGAVFLVDAGGEQVVHTLHHPIPAAGLEKLLSTGVGAFEHPSVAPTIAVREVGSGLCFVTPPPRGRPLLEWRNEGRSTQEVSRLVADLASVVEELVEAGLSPQILLPRMVRVEAGDGPLVSNLAFELWSGPMVWGAELDWPVNRIHPDLLYAAPEQTIDLISTRPQAVAVYQLGVLLYELFAHRPPHRDEQVTKALLQIRNDAPPPLSEVPGELAAVVDRCLAKDPRERFARPADLATALHTFIY